jgi:hypothetical protein
MLQLSKKKLYFYKSMLKNLIKMALLCLPLGLNAQQHNVVVSAGYGFPSILRFAISNANLNTTGGYYFVDKVSGYGPVHGKLEYIYGRRVGIALSTVYNTLQVDYRSKFHDTFRLNVNEMVLGARLNAYIINKPKQMLYLGVGAGTIDFFNESVRTSRINDTFNQRSTPIRDFESKLTVEATLGYRFFPYKGIGVYTEIGTGKLLWQFRKLGFIDSWLQAGVSWRIMPWRDNRDYADKPKKIIKEKAEVIE